MRSEERLQPLESRFLVQTDGGGEMNKRSGKGGSSWCFRDFPNGREAFAGVVVFAHSDVLCLAPVAAAGLQKLHKSQTKSAILLTRDERKSIKQT